MQNVCQLRPESRGTIALKTCDPADPPVIRANYLAEEADRRTLVAGLRLARKIAAQRAMQHFIEFEYLPGEHVCTDEDCRVGEDVATLTPHRPGRADFPHPVLH